MQMFRRGFPSPNIFAIAFSFSIRLSQVRAAVHSRPLKSPEKTTKPEAVSPAWRNCYQQGQSAAVSLELGMQITHTEIHWPQEYSVVCSLSKKQKVIPGKTMREDTWLLPSLSQPSVGLLTGGMWGQKVDQGDKFRQSCVFQLMYYTVLG